MSGSGFAQFIPLILIFVIFYFFLIRPQQKKAKEHKLMVAALKRGDEVVTSGGIVGKVERILDNLINFVLLIEQLEQSHFLKLINPIYLPPEFFQLYLQYLLK